MGYPTETRYFKDVKANVLMDIRPQPGASTITGEVNEEGQLLENVKITAVGEKLSKW